MRQNARNPAMMYINNCNKKIMKEYSIMLQVVEALHYNSMKTQKQFKKIIQQMENIVKLCKIINRFILF